MIQPPLDIAGAIENARINEAVNFPRASNYMSDIGHPCERRLVYARTNWEERIRPNPVLIGIFRDGNIHEEAVMEELKKAGFQVTEQQMRFYDPESKLSGKCDGRIRDGREHAYLFEIKSISQFTWAKIRTVEDMLNAEQHYVRHWPIQLNLYLHFDKTPVGVFLLKNKANAIIKPVWVEYNEASALESIEKAKRVNAHVEAKTLPDRISPDLRLCQDCDFRLVCLPDINMGDGMEIVSDAALLEMLSRRDELAGTAKEYESLDKLVKEAVRGRNVVVGDYRCTSKEVQKKAFQVAASTHWKVTIERWR